METGYKDRDGYKIYVGMLFSHEDSTVYEFVHKNGKIVLYNCSGLPENPNNVDFSKVKLDAIQL